MSFPVDLQAACPAPTSDQLAFPLQPAPGHLVRSISTNLEPFYICKNPQCEDSHRFECIRKTGEKFSSISIPRVEAQKRGIACTKEPGGEF